MKYSYPCLFCGKLKYYKEQVRTRQKNAKCSKCVEKYGRLNSCRLYTRVCDTCGDVCAGKTRKENSTCIECSRERIGSKLVDFREKESYTKSINYFYFCPTCPSIKIVKPSQKRKSKYCQDCNRKYYKHELKSERIYFDYNMMKIVVPLVVKKSRINKKSSLFTKTKKRTSKKAVSVEAIERARQINREHKRLQNEPAISVVSKKSDTEMIEEFLKNNQPSVIDTVTEIPHMFSIGILSNDYLI